MKSCDEIRKKVKYEAPIVEVLYFAEKDAIVTSGEGLQPENEGVGNELEW